jgi:hypothetical protein
VTTAGPCLRWWRTRAIPAPETNMRIVAPLIIATTLRLPTGKSVKFDPEGARNFIEDLVRSQEIVSWQLGTSSDNVYVVNYEERPGYAEWSQTDHKLESLCFVEMLTVE